jgi:hypothetical protein
LEIPPCRRSDGRPLAEQFADVPDLAPFTALRPALDLEEKNVEQSSLSIESESLDLSLEDRADEDTFNRILWAAVKGVDRPYPGPVTGYEDQAPF